MKKLFCLMLALLMTLSLCACGGSGEDKKEGGAKADTFDGLHVGYAREKLEVNLGQDIPMGGYGNTDKRLAQGMLDYIYITCVAFAEGDKTILLYTQDLISTSASQVSYLNLSGGDRAIVYAQEETNVLSTALVTVQDGAAALVVYFS